MNTIKNIISAVVISLLPMWASAQNEGHRVSIIPHAGVTISKMDGSALTASKEWKAGYTFGASVEIPLSQYYSLTTGADFSLIGTGFKEQKEKYASVNEKLDVTYISVPLQLKSYFSDVKGLATHIGVQVGLLVSAKDKITINSIRTMNLGDGTSSMYLWESYKEKKSESVSSNFRNIVIGIPFGLSYEWRHITLDATYCFEFIKAINLNSNDPWGFFSDSPSERNHAVYITAGYKFTL
mgnify:FL=1